MTKNDILETISNLYDYEFKNGSDGTILCYYASDPDKLLYQFQSKNQLMMHWLPDFENDNHGNFTEEIEFIKSCMINDFINAIPDADILNAVPGHYSFRKVADNDYLVYKITDRGVDITHSFTINIANNRIMCNGQDYVDLILSYWDDNPKVRDSFMQFKHDWYDMPKEIKTIPGNDKKAADKKHTYLITMAAVESADMEIELTDKEYEIVERVFHEMDSKCHGLCGSVYIESRERDDMNEMDLEDREV